MKLSDAEKSHLVQQYMPALLIGANDIGAPVDPATYVKRAALWNSSGSKLDDPDTWGMALPGGGRKPLVEKGHLSLDTLPVVSSAPLASTQRAGEYWLDCSGWLDAEKVAPGSDNRQPNVAALKTLFGGANQAPTIRAEVCDEDSWSAVGKLKSAQQVLGLSGDDLQASLQQVVIINYVMLFAGHEEQTTDLFSDGKPYGAGDHEADWVCLSVVFKDSTRIKSVSEKLPVRLRSSNGQLTKLAPHLKPAFVAYSRRYRDQSNDYGAQHIINRFAVRSWEQASKSGTHVLAIAANGTHNLYPADVKSTSTGNVQAPDQNGLQITDFGWGDNVTDDTNEWVSNVASSYPEASAAVLGVILAKIAAGNAVFGVYGAVGGLIAGIAEASHVGKAVAGVDPRPEPESPEVDPSDTKHPDGDLEDPKDRFKEPSDGEKPAYVLISGEDGTVNAETALSSLTFGATIAQSLTWSAASSQPINRTKEKFWPAYDSIAPQGYIGRWGVRCGSDPYDRRAGDILPDFRVEVVRSLLASL